MKRRSAAQPDSERRKPFEHILAEGRNLITAERVILALKSHSQQQTVITSARRASLEQFYRSKAGQFRRAVSPKLLLYLLKSCPSRNLK